MNSLSPSSLHRSRLVRRLKDLHAADVQVQPNLFAETFGQLFDLSGTMLLSQVLETLSAAVPKPGSKKIVQIRETFLGERADLLRFIANGFVPGAAGARGHLPSPAEYHTHCIYTGVYGEKRGALPGNPDAAYEPYREFYVARQGKLAAKIHHLRSHIADAVAGQSPELAQLVSLDQGLEQVLSNRRKRLMDAIPGILEKRFGELLHTHWQELPNEPEAGDVKLWMTPGGWIWSFCELMREVLLAELEIRLLPVLGLIDALDETAVRQRNME